MFAREMKTEKALFMYGDGANGKSVAQEVIVSALGNEKNISSYTLEKLVADNGNARAGFMGKLANISPELGNRSEEHTSELQSLMRTSYAVFCWTKEHTTNR